MLQVIEVTTRKTEIWKEVASTIAPLVTNKEVKNMILVEYYLAYIYLILPLRQMSLIDTCCICKPRAKIKYQTQTNMEIYQDTFFSFLRFFLWIHSCFNFPLARSAQRFPFTTFSIYVIQFIVCWLIHLHRWIRREKLSETSRDQRWQLPVCLYQAGVIIFCKRRYHGWNFLRGLIFLSLSDKQINIL